MRRKVKDVMTTEVACVSPETPYKELVRLLEEHRVSALPVTDDRRHVVGVVSEVDLLLKEQLPPVSGRASLPERRGRRIQRAKARGLVAKDVMTSPVVSIGESATVAHAASLLHARDIKHLPVENAVGRLVGIVTRSDLLRVFLRPDGEIHREVADKVLPHDAAARPRRIDVEVRDGVVTLRGLVEGRSQIPLVVGAVNGVEGVVGVDNQLHFDTNDTLLTPVFP